MKISNTIAYLLITAFTLVVLSCNDDEAIKKNEDNIIGEWKLVNYAYDDCKSVEDEGFYSASCNSESCLKFTFSIDSTGLQEFVIDSTTEAVLYSTVGKYTIGENKLTLCVEEEGETDCWSYSMKVTFTTLQLSSANENRQCKDILYFEKQ